MRVIAGKCRGTKLYSLEGSNTRPTLDRVKESIFSSIQFDLKNAVCADIFAGSGSLGIEALSRGALHVDFCDSNQQAIEVIKKNIEKTGFIDRSSTNYLDAFQFISTIEKQYDFVFLDPPYERGFIQKAIEEFFEKNLIKNGMFFVCEHEKSLILPDTFRNLKIQKQKTFSNTSVTMYKAIY